MPAIRFVFPHAPVRPVTINNGYQMRAWYDIIGIDRRSAEDFDGHQRIRGCDRRADPARESSAASPRNRIAIAGFLPGRRHGAAHRARGTRKTSPASSRCPAIYRGRASSRPQRTTGQSGDAHLHGARHRRIPWCPSRSAMNRVRAARGRGIFGGMARLSDAACAVRAGGGASRSWLKRLRGATQRCSAG